MSRRFNLFSFTGLTLAALIGLIAVSGAHAAEPAAEASEAPATLRIGDKAANLSPEILWLRNMLVPEFKQGTVYIVYLWSTDSPNSMGSFPQLHGLDMQFREQGVVTISIAIDMTPGGFEPIDVIKSRAEFMAHTVAEDRGTHIKDHWYTPTGYTIAPVVFVINQDGVIAYMDTKLSEIEDVVRQVINGDWDINAAIAEFDEIRNLEARMESVIDEATTAATKGNWSRVVELAQVLLDADKEHYYKMSMTKFMLNLTKLNKPGDAYQWGYVIIDDHIRNDSTMLVTMADTILFTPGIPFRDYNLARKAAERADALTDGKLAQVQNALAAAWMELGDPGKAIEFQMKAVEMAPTTDKRQEYQAKLDHYLNQSPAQ